MLTAIYLYANFDREEFWRTQTTFEKTYVYTRHVHGRNNYASTGLRQNAVDIELILEAQEILITRTSTFDGILLLTGDGDFLPLIRKIRAWGKEVKVIGVNGSVHHLLLPFCDTVDFLGEFLTKVGTVDCQPENYIEKGVSIIASLQLSLVYVASTKARTALANELNLTVSQVKELIRYALKETIFYEKEYPDSSLKIGKTKIYLLNLDHALVKKVLGSLTKEVQEKYGRMSL